MANSKYLSSLKLAVIFFLLAASIDLVISLQSANWVLSLTDLQLDLFTLLVPLLVFAWQLVSEYHATRVIAATDQLSHLIQALPESVRLGTKAEVNVLKSDNEEFRRQLARGVFEHDQHYYRTLTYQREEGSLFKKELHQQTRVAQRIVHQLWMKNGFHRLV